MSTLQRNSTVGFEPTAEVSPARAGTLSVNGRTLETPYLLPVVNFYAGGRKSSLFGGGIHRTIKEYFVAEDPEIDPGAFDHLFEGVMTSVSSLFDYNPYEGQIERYTREPIRDREPFESYDGMIFVDSGGYKLLQNEGVFEGPDFKIEADPSTVYRFQEQLGGDIFVPLDHPMGPDDDYDTRVSKAEQTIANANQFLDLSSDFRGARFLPVHGYNQSMIERFFDIAETELNEPIGTAFDGIGLGGLVPKKDNIEVLIQAVRACRTEMDRRGLEEFPLHVFGISGRAIPLLIAVGADTFDSASYIYSAINGKYLTPSLEATPLDDAEFDWCDCSVCSNHELVSRMNGDAEYQKDILGPVAIHNIAMIQQTISDLRETIKQQSEADLVKHLENVYDDHKSLRKPAYRVINDTYTSFF